MTGLPPEAEELLAQARRSHGPSEEDRKRMLTSLHATIGIASAVPLVAAASSAAALGEGSGAVAAVKGAGVAKGLGALFSYKATKLVLATVLLGGATSVAVLPTLQRAEPSRAPAASAPSAGGLPSADARPETEPAREMERGQASQAGVGGRAAADSEPRAPTTAHASARAIAQARQRTPALQPDRVRREQQGTRAGSRLRASTARERPRRERQRDDRGTVSRGDRLEGAAASADFATHRPTGSSANSSAAEELRTSETASEELPAIAIAPEQQQAPRELALIRRALTSLRDHQAGAALVLLDEHEERYPRGVFSTERDGLRAIALCTLGRRSEGKQARAAFLRAAGEAPIAARVRRACEREP